MVRLCDQDAKALDGLFSRYSRLVYGIAFRILRDSGEAEEAVQESFLYVYRKALTFDPRKGSARAWIVQVAYSRARDRKDQLSRRGFYVRRNIDSLDLEETLAGQEDLESEIGAKLDLIRLQGAFNELTASQRETLEMFYFQDMELREISERLRKPLGNIRHHYYRGLERLRRNVFVKRVRSRNGTDSGARPAWQVREALFSGAD